MKWYHFNFIYFSNSYVLKFREVIMIAPELFQIDTDTFDFWNHVQWDHTEHRLGSPDLKQKLGRFNTQFIDLHHC